MLFGESVGLLDVRLIEAMGEHIVAGKKARSSRATAEDQKAAECAEAELMRLLTEARGQRSCVTAVAAVDAYLEYEREWK